MPVEAIGLKLALSSIAVCQWSVPELICGAILQMLILEVTTSSISVYTEGV